MRWLAILHIHLHASTMCWLASLHIDLHASTNFTRVAGRSGKRASRDGGKAGDMWGSRAESEGCDSRWAAGVAKGYWCGRSVRKTPPPAECGDEFIEPLLPLHQV